MGHTDGRLRQHPLLRTRLRSQKTMSENCSRSGHSRPACCAATRAARSSSVTRCTCTRPFPNIVYALDLKNDGRILWRYEPKQDPNVIPVMCCDTVYRGLAYSDGKIFLHQADTTLVALDAQSGKVALVGRKWRSEEGRDEYRDRPAGQGQGDRRHFRRRVRRARPRDCLRHQYRQAGMACLLDRARTTKCSSTATRRQISASRSARIRA